MSMGAGAGAGWAQPSSPPGLHTRAGPGREDEGSRSPGPAPLGPLGQPARFWSNGWKAVLGGLGVDAFLTVPSSSLSPGDTEPFQQPSSQVDCRHQPHRQPTLPPLRLQAWADPPSARPGTGPSDVGPLGKLRASPVPSGNP